jgi:hypothetical protein
MNLLLLFFRMKLRSINVSAMSCGCMLVFEDMSWMVIWTKKKFIITVSFLVNVTGSYRGRHLKKVISNVPTWAIFTQKQLADLGHRQLLVVGNWVDAINSESFISSCLSVMQSETYFHSPE